ncbi:hypothetical protein PIB30_054239 [Stylosanthes scabra]|uniref:Uncharacterized protein n=1 Tax=Stylosanthes scabra TaxID=79078 RepID=A0ABU6XH94_9FABA|nr:hypothetical protein [Stylosanthes scabra]
MRPLPADLLTELVEDVTGGFLGDLSADYLLQATKPNTPSSSLTPNPSELEPSPSLPALPSTVVKGASKTPQYPHFIDVVLGNRRGSSPPSARDPCRHCFYHHRVVVLQRQPPPPHPAVYGNSRTAPANLHFHKG